MINNGKLFAGLDRIDWVGMSHAYGSAVEVPELLRGLVAEDPARRETALGAVGRPDLSGSGGIGMPEFSSIVE